MLLQVIYTDLFIEAVDGGESFFIFILSIPWKQSWGYPTNDTRNKNLNCVKRTAKVKMFSSTLVLPSVANRGGL